MTDDQKAIDAEQLLREAGDRLLALGDKGFRRYWAAANELHRRAAASLEAQEPVAWIVEREGDATFPRLMRVKGDAERLVQSITVHQKATMRPLVYYNPPTSAVPDGYVMLPAKLTAENGAKSALMGEFHERVESECPDCGGDSCLNCDFKGHLITEIPVSWTTIKRIHDAVVQHFADRQPEPTSAVPQNCRQRLMSEGKPYPRSSCAACGSFSPKWKECDAALAAPQQGGAS